MTSYPDYRRVRISGRMKPIAVFADNNSLQSTGKRNCTGFFQNRDPVDVEMA
jgi:hypothetical protein